MASASEDFSRASRNRLCAEVSAMLAKSMEMFLKLTLGNQKEHYELHRLIVERVEVDAFARAAQRADYFKNQIRRSVRNTDAEADARGH